MNILKRILAHIIANGAALYFVGILLEGDFMITGGWKGYLIGGILFGLLNGIIKPILKILSLPFVLITAGFFILVINMFLVWFAKYSLNILDFEGVTIVVENGITTYFIAGFLISILNWVITWLLKK